jgi:hypothetical protein
MSLLQRLAERALGVAAAPLRSQRAVLAPQGLAAHAETALPAVLAPVSTAAAPQAPVVHKLEDHGASPVPHQPVPNVSPVIVPLPVPTVAKAAPAAAVFAPPAVGEPPRVLQTAPHVASTTVVNTLMPQLAQRVESTDVPARLAERPAMTSTDSPEPLLPAQPPDAMTPQSAAPPPLASRPEHHDTRRRGSAQENVTEVHVSIGRVELTALAAAPAAARGTQRSREPSRSLADYLRPPGHGKGQGTS